MTQGDFEKAIAGYKLVDARVIMKNGTTGKVWRVRKTTRGLVALILGDDGRVWKASPGAFNWED